MNFETERLILRPLTTEDALAIYELAKDPEVGPSAGWPAHKNADQSRQIIQTVLNGPACFGMILKETGKLVGVIELMLYGSNERVKKEDESELGFWLGKEYWGNGYVKEASDCLLKYGFEDLKLNKIWCGYYAENVKSKRVQEKIGFHYVKTEKDVYLSLLDETRDEIMNVITAEEYFS